jgi:C_GCAxxG_C_C family probable redox protein
LLAVSQELGIECPGIPRIATPFGGGFGGRGEVCGAVIGSLMAIGLKHGREEPSQPNQQAYALAREFCRRFEEETGSLYCRELTGMDLSTPEGLKAFHTSDVPLRVCLPAAGAAFRLVTELLTRPEPAAGDD